MNAQKKPHSVACTMPEIKPVFPQILPGQRIDLHPPSAIGEYYSGHGNMAFVGLSKPRYKRFEGLELDRRLKDADSEPWCGIQIIDLTSGSCVDWFRIDGKIGELYDLEVIPGVCTPMAVAPHTQEAASLITFASDQNP